MVGVAPMALDRNPVPPPVEARFGACLIGGILGGVAGACSGIKCGENRTGTGIDMISDGPASDPGTYWCRLDGNAGFPLMVELRTGPEFRQKWRPEG